MSSGPQTVRRVALAIIRRADRFAVVRRQSSDMLAGLWEFPGGRIETGESPSQAAVREAFEETGLRVRAARELPAIAHAYPHLRVELHPVMCELDPRSAASFDAAQAAPTPGARPARPATDTSPPRSSLASRLRASPVVRWVSRDELASLDMPAANAKILRLIDAAGSSASA